MIDPYRAPRIQRMVPWRTPKTAAGIELLAQASRNAMMAHAQAIATGLCMSVYRLVLEPELVESALLSGAMPTEFNARELRAPDPVEIVSPR